MLHPVPPATVLVSVELERVHPETILPFCTRALVRLERNTLDESTILLSNVEVPIVLFVDVLFVSVEFQMVDVAM